MSAWCDSGSALSALILCGRAIRRAGWEDGILLAPGNHSPLAWLTVSEGRVTSETPMSSLGPIDLLQTDWLIL